MNQLPIPDSLQLGRSLRIWRSLRRLKQQAVASLMEVSQTTVSRWESGQASPTLPEQHRLREMMAARLDSAADFALGRLVRESRTAMHLTCDLSHRLLALSAARERCCLLPGSELMGTVLWRYATPQIIEQERRLDELGWFEPCPDAIEFETEASLDQVMPIQRSRMRWIRLQLSDGTFVRLTETLQG